MFEHITQLDAQIHSAFNLNFYMAADQLISDTSQIHAWISDFC